jgi:hypothetical protein
MSIFGQTIIGIHLGLLLVNAITIALIFLLGRRLITSRAGIATAASYAILSVSPAVVGFAAHAEHFVMVPVLAGTLLLLHESDQQGWGDCSRADCFLGLALVMKQRGAFFILFVGIYLISREVYGGFELPGLFLRILMFTTGVILPFGITCLVLSRAGVFRQFWFWTIDYVRQYASIVPLNGAPKIFSVAQRKS